LITYGLQQAMINYYTKRLILAGIYTSVLLFWLNDDSKNLKKTENFLKKQLKKTLFIGKIKKSIINFSENNSSILNFKKKLKGIF